MLLLPKIPENMFFVTETDIFFSNQEKFRPPLCRPISWRTRQCRDTSQTGPWTFYQRMRCGGGARYPPIPPGRRVACFLRARSPDCCWPASRPAILLRREPDDNDGTCLTGGKKWPRTLALAQAPDAATHAHRARKGHECTRALTLLQRI